jgi:hydroxymethylbilane synthase
MHSRILKLGTRKSLLAWAQSSWVARQIETLNPGTRVELVGIETRGDKIQDIPLQKVEGKDFFVAELDDALRSGRVDLSVHSMKDLSLERPSEFVLAAVPPRELPHDVIFFSNSALLRHEAGEPIRIGTSSPRRLENIPAFLAKAFPKAARGHPPRFEWVEIRGNVNTRLGRLHEPVNNPRALEGVVLAMAGIQRLYHDAAGREALKLLLRHVRWMVLPLKENPTAPAQGALAVECRRDDTEAFAMIRKLHHPDSAKAAAMERALLEEWGGGCHQRFGATALSHPLLGQIMYVGGKMPNGTEVHEVRWKAEGAPSGTNTWDGKQWRAAGQENALEKRLPDLTGKTVFVAHWRAAAKCAPALKQSRVWTSGTGSWFKLAEQGVFVEGCAENLGFDSVLPLMQRDVLELGPTHQWHVLTHNAASGEWDSVTKNIHATYELAESAEPTQALQALESADQIFLSSYSQFERVRKHIKSGAQISCGPGRTAKALGSAGVNVKVFPSEKEWREWVEKK